MLVHSSSEFLLDRKNKHGEEAGNENYYTASLFHKVCPCFCSTQLIAKKKCACEQAGHFK